MKKHSSVLTLLLLMLALCVAPVFAQNAATVKGVCKDAQGNPIVDGIVLYANQDSGQKYPLKTNKKGEYFSLGVTSGTYTVTLYKNADDQKANKDIFHFNKFQVATGENSLDFQVHHRTGRSRRSDGRNLRN